MRYGGQNGSASGSKPPKGRGGNTGQTGSPRQYPDKKSGKSFRVPANAKYGVNGVGSGGGGNFGSKGV